MCVLIEWFHVMQCKNFLAVSVVYIVISTDQSTERCTHKSLPFSSLEITQKVKLQNKVKSAHWPELKNFAIDRPSQPFLGHHLDFTTFSPWPSCVGLPDLAAPFFTAWMAVFKYIQYTSI